MTIQGYSKIFTNNPLPKTRPAVLLLSIVLGLIFASLLSGCADRPSPTPDQVTITIVDNGSTTSVAVQTGATVQAALDQAGITLNSMDQVDPPTFTLVDRALTVTITRVEESFETEDQTIPFEHQTVRNESLPEGDLLLIQPGVNGTQQITYRVLSQNGVQTSRSQFKVETLQEAQPEIIMVGVQSPFTPVDIPGKLAYLTGGNAWLMEVSTSNRRPLVTTGDLDGRVFSISTDGQWLLFTRKLADDTVNINSLWLVSLTADKPEPVDLGVNNIIQYAGWNPQRTSSVLYSTVEPRSTAPGWQANNDLFRIVISDSGKPVRTDELIEANSGGIYGWWGTNFVFSPSGDQIAYARPDSIGLVDLENKEFQPLVDLLPFQTGSDWAWVPGVAWSPDGKLLYTVTHAALPGASEQESSPLFDLSAFVMDQGPLINLVSQSGMFAYPSLPASSGAFDTKIAYLQAIFPEQSDTSRYKLMVMDQDGSNGVSLFPAEGSAGLEPQQPKWAPGKSDPNSDMIAIVYQGNIYLISVTSDQSQQITGDGLISGIDWR